MDEADPHILKLAAIAADMVLSPDFNLQAAANEDPTGVQNCVVLLAKGFRGVMRGQAHKPRFRVRARSAPAD